MAMKKQQAELLRPNFGQHTPAIDELRKILMQTTQYRDSTQERVEVSRKRLQEEEQKLSEYSRKIESYKGAIRALGGKAPDEPEHGIAG